MKIFSRILGLFSRRHCASVVMRPVTLVNERTESQPGHFVFPGTDFVDHIQVDGQRVGQIDYSINPLRDRLYINMIELRPGSQRQGIGSAVLWHLWQLHGLPIVPLYEYTTSEGFWCQARARLGAAGVKIEAQLRGVRQMELEQERWQHLVPEPEHKRLIRELMASPEWPAIKARHDAERNA
ncbi:N-acetyltransferase [Pseudomonas syringae pv. atrofaciens]|nr:N-acetyltransferase [Pseudomonas syringae pv. atrofaciens]POP73839.1 GNAT family N-acetyltransferase [Pseudomonas syringae]QGL59710.1 GNAT family N-acetyltransferase [Pseudomonas coronafaciens pv. oryzae str. 1_6]